MACHAVPAAVSFGLPLLLLILSLSAAGKSRPPTLPSTPRLIVVDKAGGGDVETIQDAIDMVPSGNSEPVLIFVKPGTYNESVVIPEDKPLITLSGRDAKTTIITWKEPWDDTNAATLSVHAPDFVGSHLTLENTYGKSRAAIAVQVMADRVAFFSCRMLSYQDTLLDDQGRHYYSNCYIQGATDFICGNGLALFQNCSIHSISENGGSITAQRRAAASENTGYSFLDCKVTSINGGSAILGRPWAAYSMVVFANTYLPSAVRPQGWDDWGNPHNRRTAYYGEYKCFGPGSEASKRVVWSHQLSEKEALNFTSISMIDGEKWIRPPSKRFRRFSASPRPQN